MFKTASQRTGAFASKTIQSPLPLSRTISNTTRPRLNYNNAVRRFPSQFYPRIGFQTRNLTHAQRMRFTIREASRGIWRKNPIVFPLALISVIGSIAFFVYVSYVEVTFVGPKYAKFPPLVNESLRTAVYYTEIDLNPPKALEAYKEALRYAKQLNMNPMSDEVLGIRIQVAYMLEKAGLIEQSIAVLEKIKSETKKYVDGTAKLANHSPIGTEEHKAKLRGEGDPIPIDLPEFNEYQDKLVDDAKALLDRRPSVLRKLVGIELKLADLYSNSRTADEKKVEACLVSGVELCLKEMHRRQKFGLPVGGSPDSDGWLGLTEIAVVLRELGTMYDKQDKYALALPLYLRALDLIRVDEGDNPTCKQVSLLADISTMMTHMVHLPREGKQPQLAQTADTARQWSLKAIEVAGAIKPAVREKECDESCAMAHFSLGELARLQGKLDEAREYYKTTKSIAQSNDVAVLEEAADDILAKLEIRTGKDS
ncbi:TPR domain protein [Aspergillus sclerotialis]|uniref:TPR domain protein n=1 Tax=Aspergillus sclerotialis TaxID=2070753 RepID=A0A3A2ZCW3_9EURO|nr:TPR domain protein [Aspergillus sclerotialis]